jgi:hypothetical protein
MMAGVTAQRDGRGFEAAGFALWPAILLGLATIVRLWLSGLAWTAAFALALPLLISRRATGAGTD